jgi:hypothetical protein
MRLPFYEKPKYSRFPLTSRFFVQIMDIVNFLKWVVERDQLEAANYLEGIMQDPSFLVAATGLGKTVAMPIHALIRQAQRAGAFPQPTPRAWIVEPRIPIAVDQCSFMNFLWETYQQERGNRTVPPLFGCIAKGFVINPDALIVFITTGIFELKAKNGEFKPERDRVIIDEAHVTISQNDGMELAIARARQDGITVDYMSATVDTTGLGEALSIADTNIIRADRQRHPIWRHNLLRPMEEAIVELINETLIRPNLANRYFPQSNYPDADDIRRTVLASGRSHGMLIAVNSVSGEFSDMQRLANIIGKAYPDLPLLTLSSEVVRNPRRMDAFQQRLKQIEANQQNYAIIVSSVAEMGITFPTLDYVALMDSNYTQETIGNHTFPVISPRDINSLLQMIGRVGRRFPGIAYISLEVGAEYAELDDEELNRPETLACEPISFPLQTASLMPLAYYACQQGWKDLEACMAALQLPSKLHQNLERMNDLREQIALLQTFGLAEGITLTPLGAQMEQWIGRYDLAYAAQLQRRFDEQAEQPEIMFWLVATALSLTSLANLRNQYDYFVDYERTHTSMPHDLDLWGEPKHEDLAAFKLLGQIAASFPSALRAKPDEWNRMEFDRWINFAGIDARKVREAIKAIDDTWQLFMRNNTDSSHFKTLFGSAKSFDLSQLPWQHLYDAVPTEDIWRELCDLTGTTTITFTRSVAGYAWQESQHGHIGILSQDDTPVRIKPGVTYVARVVPSRKATGADIGWHLAHLGEEFFDVAKQQTMRLSIIQPVEPTTTDEQAAPQIRQSFGDLLRKLFSFPRKER